MGTRYFLTQQDIDKANAARRENAIVSQSCPIWQMLRRRHGDVPILVGRIFFWMRLRKYVLSNEARAIINAFDSFAHVKPGPINLVFHGQTQYGLPLGFLNHADLRQPI